MEQKETLGFFVQKRKIIALCVWGALVIATVVGITVNAFAYRNGKIDVAEVYRRLQYAFTSFLCMSIVFPVEKIFRIRFSLFVEISLMLFSFFALAGGTVYGMHGSVPHYDKILHTLSGPLFCILGLELADIILKSYEPSAKKVIATVVIGFLFSLAVEYIWEIFEFSVDSLLSYNTQGWKSGLIEDFGNGTFLVSDKRGTALIDTVSDMICNLCSAFAFSAVTLVVLLLKPTRLKAFAVEKIPRKQKNQTEERSE